MEFNNKKRQTPLNDSITKKTSSLNGAFQRYYKMKKDPLDQLYSGLNMEDQQQDFEFNGTNLNDLN